MSGGSSRFAVLTGIRVTLLAATLAGLAWLIVNTEWYAGIAITAAVALLQFFALLYSVSVTNREIARFLNAIEFDDASQTFSDRRLGGSFRELGPALNRVMDRLRQTRGEREEQAHLLRSLVEHVPVALLSVYEEGGVRPLNSAARRLFTSRIVQRKEDLNYYGDAFAQNLLDLAPGATALVKMDRGGAPLHLKAAATQVIISGIPQRLISLQNIESELNAQELAAWQALIRVLTHEMMNSLTPVSSLSSTAHALVSEARTEVPENAPYAAKLADAQDALDAVARRSEGLLHFVQSYRRLTKNLVPRIEHFPIRRVFARLERLMGPDFADRGIAFSTALEPETLEVSADAELLDQALINLIRNAIDVLKDQPERRIRLSAKLDADGNIAISVSDNGPGVPAENRERIFVPFYTTKRQGTGVGLSLTRQIALVHGASIDVGDTPGGGATFTLRFR
jgi:two-component system, NtrC family, nitrogen regulation sensor histidine kinase NtrY